MARYTKTGTPNTVGEINSQLDLISTAIADTLSRKGDVPNQMETSLDANSNRILNLPKPLSENEPARLSDLAGSSISVASAITTVDLIASTTVYLSNTIVTTNGYTASGDSGKGDWKQNGVINQTVSQSPAQLSAPLLNDASGNQWALVQGSGGSLSQLGVDNITFSIPTAFPTISSAINFLSGFSPKTNQRVTLSLETGFSMQEQVFVYGINLGWITISSVDAEVNVARSSLTTVLGSLDTSRPAFGGINCVMPKINVLFRMDTSGSAAGRQDGLFVENGKAIVLSGAGFQDFTEVGIYANSGSEINAEGSLCSGNGVYGYFAFKASNINCQNAIANNCGQYGLYVNRASQGSANGATFNNAGVNAVRIIRGSALSWENGVGTGSGAEGIFALSSTVQALGANVSGSTGSGVYAHDVSTVGFRNGNASGCGGTASLWAFRGATIDADNATASTSSGSTAAVLAQRASTINFQSGTVNPSTSPRGIRASEGSTINAVSANAQTTASPLTSDATVFAGGQLVFTSGTGGVSQTINVLAAEGIIYQ